MMLKKHKLVDLGLELTFTVDIDCFGKGKTIELIPGGSNTVVTDDNKDEYIRSVCQYKMVTSIRPQMDQLLRGLYEIVPKENLQLFTPSEIELLLGGCPSVDLNDMAANTLYVGWNVDDEQIGWFWDILRSFNQSDLGKFLQFVTGTSRVPHLGFAYLSGIHGEQKFTIQKRFGGSNRLPSAHTCFNQLNLPVYDSAEMMRGKFMYAVREGNEGFGFI